MARTLKPTGYVVYRGPSMLDGAPIVAIALTGSSNRKTGNMVQTYILRADVAPLDALRSGADASICGDCKHRPVTGGACYVQVERGPTVVFKALLRGRYPAIMEPAALAMARGPAGDAMRQAWADGVVALGAGRMVRLGTYGDPMAVPAYVWQALTARAAGVTGYTHQWRNQEIAQAQREAVARLCMASADTPDEAQAARDAGLRYFRIRTAAEPLMPREMVCPASEEAGKRLTCATCGACNGSAKPTAGSVAIVIHGAKKRRYVEMRAA